MWIVGTAFAVLVGLVIAVNAAFMLASPRRWFHLPTWLRAKGSLTVDKYANGWGAVQVRFTEH